MFKLAATATLRSISSSSSSSSASSLLRNMSTKVTVLGASGGIGQPLSMLLKLSPYITELACYDIANTPGVAADLSHVRNKLYFVWIFHCSRCCTSSLFNPLFHSYRTDSNQGQSDWTFAFDRIVASHGKSWIRSGIDEFIRSGNTGWCST